MYVTVGADALTLHAAVTAAASACVVDVNQTCKASGTWLSTRMEGSGGIMAAGTAGCCCSRLVCLSYVLL